MDLTLGKYKIQEINQTHKKEDYGWKLYYNPYVLTFLSHMGRHLVAWLESMIPTMERVVSINEMIQMIMAESEIYIRCHQVNSGCPIKINIRPKLVTQDRDMIRIDFVNKKQDHRKIGACLFSPSPVYVMTEGKQKNLVKRRKHNQVTEYIREESHTINLMKKEFNKFYSRPEYVKFIPDDDD